MRLSGSNPDNDVGSTAKDHRIADTVLTADVSNSTAQHCIGSFNVKSLAAYDKSEIEWWLSGESLATLGLPLASRFLKFERCPLVSWNELICRENPENLAKLETLFTQ